MPPCPHVGMKIIAIESQKGGSGKTTIAVHLAQAFAAGGYQTLLLDLDPQTSAAEWKDVRADESPAVMAVPQPLCSASSTRRRKSALKSSFSTPPRTVRERHWP